MSRAFSLARRGTGKTSPNPLVGAVIASGGRVIGEGWHRRYGGKHAEAEAFDAVIKGGHTPLGADLYCTLEPCCYTAPEKKQPPCTERIISSGIKRVVIANRDPNPKVNGGGVRALEDAGIKVEGGLMEADGEALNEGFFTFNRLGRPFIRLKIAQSLDGRIACAGGDSRWITGEAARRAVHRMRRNHDAVLIGRGTALADDPELTVRLVRGANPLRVVLDSELSLPLTARLFNLPDKDKTLVLCTHGAYSRKSKQLVDAGIQVMPIDGESPNGLSLKAALAALGGLGVRSVLVEGGSAVWTAFLQEGLWDSLAVFIAPLILGEGINSVGNLGIQAVRDALRCCGKMRAIGDDFYFEGNNVYRNS